MPTLLQRLRRVAPYFRPSRPGIVLALLAAAVSAATEPMIPALLKPLLDKGFTGGELSLWLVPVAIIGLYVVRGAASFCAQYALSWSANGAVLGLRESMFGRLLDAAPSLFGARTASGLTNTVVYEVQQGAGQLVGAMLTLVRDSLTIVALLGYLLWLNWRLTLFVLLLAPAVAIVMRVVSKRLQRLAVAGQNATDELAYVVEENVMAWRIVRLHGAGASQQARFRQQGQRLRHLVMKSAAAGAIVSPITQLLASVALSAVIAMALWQSQGGTTTSVGDFVAFVAAMLMMTSPMKHVADIAGPLTRGLAALERGIDLVENVAAESGGSYAPPGRTRGELVLEQVSLQYRADQPPALDRIDLQLKAGETVALVGPSGAGKSSLVHLLPRFLEPTDGRITLDGVPLQDWQIAALRRQFALVSQDVVLFNDTLAANVALGDTLDPQRVHKALRDANLHEFVERLPQGIDTPIGHNGSQLSGGQRQRVAIARAIYKDAPILILDEATSALDSESERAVQTALERLMQGRTTLVIAHRLSTIEHADRVVAMDQGRIVEQGSHAELLARNGLYARLHAMQFRTAPERR
ncbi:lipid A export permease/ATP-binding protein MsbA [Aquincola sp. MAHUQ-54]|uniref:Lipid A export permease/ATP-binding protein MsbA n=1 Tax=Aquincola agrisoli TaxID=3119538 RepID=A0AAW9QDY8_9BURK